MTNAKVVAAATRFTADVTLTELFVTTASECFKRATQAAARQKDLTGDRTAYTRVTPAHKVLYDALIAAETSGECDDALTDLELEDDFAQALTDAAKDDLGEAGRVEDKLTYVATATSIPVLNMLKHGEADESVLDAIDAKIIELS